MYIPPFFMNSREDLINSTEKANAFKVICRQLSIMHANC